MASTLPARDAETLRASTYTYPEVGATAGAFPAGYGTVERSAVLVRRDFERAAADLFAWRLQEWAGLAVHAGATPLRPGTDVLMRLGLGRASIRIPCRVVHTIEEPRRRGFAYGTLQGHPEAGEELFVLEQQDDGTIRISISAFSRPATRLARLGGPMTGAFQRVMTARYLRALDSPASG